MHVEFISQAYLCNTVDVAQAFLLLKVRMPLQAPLKGGNDLLAGQPQAPWAAYGQDKWPTKFSVVLGVKLLQLGKLRRAALG